MKTVRFNDLHNPFAPFSYVEEKVNSRKNIKCHISKKTIEKGENIYAFRLFSLEQDHILFAQKTAFETSDYFINYRDYYLKNKYSINDFKNFEGFRSPDYKKILKDFSFDKAIKLITHPTTQPEPYYYPSGEIINACSKNEKLNIDRTAVTTLLSILIKCGYSNQILDNANEFPKTTLILLALLDDRRFQNKAAHILANKELPSVLEIIRKKKLSLEDFDMLKSFSHNNQPFITLLASCLEKYQIHLVDNMTNRGCFKEIEPPKNARLVYFFIANPKEFPLLIKYITDKEWPSGFTYMQCYYYKAAMFYLADKNPDQVTLWIKNMKTEIRYHFYGNPKGFINDSIKMIKCKLIKNKH